ncbi:hypothetical protein Nepgr_008264 [Nepenthes gracilis]|uniref:Protein misato homolog 1 n=1 Tax=Nepenthes gracilis TaxID=150966 RepID=A0AAD3S8J4_NEPGR|nr:hypothetical protein Nepgr_008264 [Nepenthes gracilis]
MREIITIQVGGFANFIGSHFWNFQDELLGLAADSNNDPVFKNHFLNMDVLYRTGETPEGISTYTPRVVSIDYQGSLGSVCSHGTLYNQISPVPSPVFTWRGRLSTHRSEPHKKNLFLRCLDEEEHGASNDIDHEHTESQKELRDEDVIQCLENGVQFWTDFSKVHYHPQSLYELSGLWMDAQGFDNYGIGKDVFSEGLRGEAMSDRLRFFVEECDNIQGIQFVVDDSGGFSSVAADFLENIADDYSSTPVLLYAVRSPSSYMNSTTRKRTISRDLHDSISFSRLSSFCKLLVPVGLPLLSKSKASTYLCLDDQKPYHCSAVYAAALHSLSLPFRMELHGPTANLSCVSGSSDINSIIQMLSGQSRQNMVAILDAAMPAPCLIGSLAEQPLLSNLQPLTPEVAEEEDLQSLESLVIHGVLQSGGHQASVSEVEETISAAYGNAMPMPRFSHLSVALCPLPIPLPFPSIFNYAIGKRGELLGTPALDLPSKGSLDVSSIPMAVRLRNSSAVLPFLLNRLESLRSYGIRQGAPGADLLRSWGFGKDELEDIGEVLSNMVAALDPGSNLTSDSD